MSTKFRSSVNTKKCKRAANVLLAIHVTLNVAPFAFYTIKALASNASATNKVTMSMTLAVVLVMSCIQMINHKALRSRMWILMIGIWMCLDSIIGMIVTVAIFQLVDELVVAPLYHHKRNTYIINREIDKR